MTFAVAQPRPPYPRSFPTGFLDVGVGHGWDHRSQPSSRLFSSTPASALPCPAGRSVPGRGGPERRRRPQPDGTGPSVRPGSVTHRDHRGTSGHQRSPAAKRNHRSMSLRLKQQARGQPANQIVVPKVGGLSPLGHPPLTRQFALHLPSPTGDPTAACQRLSSEGFWRHGLPRISWATVPPPARPGRTARDCDRSKVSPFIYQYIVDHAEGHTPRHHRARLLWADAAG